ncbi:hypothetical protein FRC09_006797 [Ceratobasidium sp. 395]|nr:hypothetical protein FRC09_006797 [Ceratobasidium sp. 395]
MRIPKRTAPKFARSAKPPPGFHDALTSLATAADSLSKAALAMAAAAEAMSHERRAPGTLASLTQINKVEDKETADDIALVNGLADYKSDDGSAELDSEACSSEAYSGDDISCRHHFITESEMAAESIVDDDDDDDFNVTPKVAPDNPVAICYDLGATAPCSCGPMDISQIRLSPYPPPRQPESPSKLLSSDQDSKSVTDNPGASTTSTKDEGVKFADIPGANLSSNPTNLKLFSPISDPSNSDMKPPIKNVETVAPKASSEKPLSHTRSLSLVSNPRTPATPTFSPTKPLSVQETIAMYPKLPCGRNYIQLEEDFDAIPIISCMALASKKTICLVPSPESLGAYKKILISITKLDVIMHWGGTTPAQIEESLKKLAAAPSPAILLLAFQCIPLILLETASADCVIHWGWPETRHSYVKLVTLMKLLTRSCLLLPSGDHLKPLKDSQASDYGVVKYPDSVLGSFFGPRSPIHDVRKITTQVLTDMDAETMEALYHSWLDYYGIGSTRRGDWTVIDLLNYARGYAAKTLLRGPASDGSKLYPPTYGRQLSIPEWLVRAIDSLQPIPAQSPATPEPKLEVKEPCSAPPHPIVSAVSPPSTSSSAPRGGKVDDTYFSTPKPLTNNFASPGHYYVVLDEEFDIIPFISYLGLQHQKTVCCVPSPESLPSLQKTFELFSNLAITRPNAMHEAQQAQTRLLDAKTQLMLLQSYQALEAAPLPSSAINSCICWGYPENFESYVNRGANGATQSYVLLSPEEYARPTVQSNLSKFNIKKHPASGHINDRGNGGLLHVARQKAMEQIRRTEFSSIAQSLYYAFVGYLSVGRGRPTGLTPEAIAHAANRYAARVLLRGTGEDCSKQYPPVAGRPKLTPGAIKTFKLQGAQQMGLLN